MKNIKEAIYAHKHVILHGEGGCGKTAIIKDIYNEIGKDTAFCIRKAQSLNVLSLNEIFRLSNNYTATHFKKLFTKFFIIKTVCAEERELYG